MSYIRLSDFGTSPRLDIEPILDYVGCDNK